MAMPFDRIGTGNLPGCSVGSRESVAWDAWGELCRSTRREHTHVSTGGGLYKDGM